MKVGDTVVDADGARWRVVHVVPSCDVSTPRGRKFTPGHVGLVREPAPVRLVGGDNGQ